MKNLIFEKNHNGRFIVLTDYAYCKFMNFLGIVGLPIMTFLSLYFQYKMFQHYNSEDAAQCILTFICGYIFNYSIWLSFGLYELFEDKEDFCGWTFMMGLIPYLYILGVPLMLVGKFISYIFIDDAKN